MKNKDEFIKLKNFDVEDSVIGSFLSDDELFERNPVKISYFCKEENRAIFETMIEGKRKGFRTSNLVALLDSLKTKYQDRFSASSIALLADSRCFTESDLKANIKILEKYAVYRRMYLEFEKLQSEVLESPENMQEFMGHINTVLIRVMEEFKEDKSPYIADVIERLEETREEFKKEGVVTKTGFDILDKMTGGLFPRFVWIVGAYTNTGKSFFALQTALNVLKQDKKVMIFSLEMSDLINASRLLGNVAGVGSLEIYQGGINDERYVEAKNYLSEKQLVLYDNKMDMEEISTACLKEAASGQVHLIVIDYVQNLMGKDSDSYENMVNAVKQANFIAQKTNAAILLVSQMSNDSVRSPNTRVIGYKGAGELAAGPDVGLTLERVVEESNKTSKEVDRETILCRVAKNRHGPLGRFWLKIDPASGLIEQHPDQLDCDAKFSIF